MDNWPKNSDVGFELAPPRTKRQRGRPKKLRREDPQVRQHANGSESLRRTFILRCRRCGQDGHNRRTCTNDPRIDARTEVGQSSSSQPSAPSEPPTVPRPNTRRATRSSQETLPTDSRPSTRRSTRSSQDNNTLPPSPSTRRSTRSSQDNNTLPPRPSTRRTRTHPQRCGRRGDRD